MFWLILAPGAQAAPSHSAAETLQKVATLYLRTFIHADASNAAQLHDYWEANAPLVPQAVVVLQNITGYPGNLMHTTIDPVEFWLALSSGDRGAFWEGDPRFLLFQAYTTMMDGYREVAECTAQSWAPDAATWD